MVCNFCLPICKDCGREIKSEECREVIFRDETFNILVHQGDCFKKYQEALLVGEEAKSRGRIIGLCINCEQPVRENDAFSVCRVSRRQDEDEEILEELMLTTVPQNDFIIFSHNNCENL